MEPCRQRRISNHRCRTWRFSSFRWATFARTVFRSQRHIVDMLWVSMYSILGLIPHQTKNCRIEARIVAAPNPIFDRGGSRTTTTSSSSFYGSMCIIPRAVLLSYQVIQFCPDIAVLDVILPMTATPHLIVPSVSMRISVVGNCYIFSCNGHSYHVDADRNSIQHVHIYVLDDSY